MAKKRSKGVIILAVWLMLSSAVGLLGNIMYGYTMSPLMRDLNLVWLAAAFACGIGLMLLKEWARKITIALYAFSLALGVYSLFTMGPAKLEEALADIPPEQKATAYLVVSILTAGIYLAWFFIITFFLTRPKVKEQFK